MLIDGVCDYILNRNPLTFAQGRCSSVDDWSHLLSARFVRTASW